MQTQRADHDAGVVPRQPRRLTFAPAPRDSTPVRFDAARGHDVGRPAQPSWHRDAASVEARVARPATASARSRATAALLSPVGLLVMAFGLIALMVLVRPTPGGTDASSARTLRDEGAAGAQPAAVPASSSAVVAADLRSEEAGEPARAEAERRADPAQDSTPDAAIHDPPGGGPIIAPPSTLGPAIGAKSPSPSANRRPPPPATAVRPSATDRASRQAAAPDVQRASPVATAPVRLSACDRLGGLREAQCRQCSAMGLIAREFCAENVRLSWCANRWGRSVDCPVAVVPTPN